MKYAASLVLAAGMIAALPAAPLLAQSKPTTSSSSGGTSVPEPAGIALLGLGIGLYLGGAQMRRRRDKK